jgi:hypothetical protein
VPLPLSEYAIDFAESSTRRKDSTLPISGFGAPCAHHHPDLRAREFDLACRMHRAAPAKFFRGVSVHDHDVGLLAPRQARRDRLGESPIEGPRVVTRRWPLARSNAGPTSE